MDVLRLIIVTRPNWGTRPEQRDTDKHRIEETLNRFVIQIYKVADDVRQEQIRHKQWEREAVERQEREHKEWLARQEFEKREKELLRGVNGWRLAQEVREYVIESLKVLNDAGLVVTKGGEIDDRLSWAMCYADRVDPRCELRVYVRGYWTKREGANPSAEPLT
ncbi:MAG: hypothetical protein IPJ19_07095 [Planctomycetes bacterium]|nr:hypothetical protein [Planctomycetota bacterium]